MLLFFLFETVAENQSWHYATETYRLNNYCTEPRKGHFFSNIYQKRNRNKKN